VLVGQHLQHKRERTGCSSRGRALQKYTHGPWFNPSATRKRRKGGRKRGVKGRKERREGRREGRKGGREEWRERGRKEFCISFTWTSCIINLFRS
jgi:hypothetical protein